MPDAMVAKSLGVCLKTIQRWDDDADLEFPDAVWINGRKYRRIKQLQQFILNRIKGKSAA